MGAGAPAWASCSTPSSVGGRTPARPRGRARPRPPFRQWADGRVSTGVAAGRCDTRPVLTAGRHCPHLPAALVPQAGLPGGESSAPSASSCCHMSLSGGTAGWPHSRHPLPPPQPSPCRQRRGPGSPARIRFVCRGLCGRSRTFAGHLHGRPGLRFFTNPWSRRRVGRLFYEGPGGTSGRSSPSAAVSPVVGMYAELWRASAPPEASGVALVTPPPGARGAAVRGPVPGVFLLETPDVLCRRVRPALGALCWLGPGGSPAALHWAHGLHSALRRGVDLNSERPDGAQNREEHVPSGPRQ